MLFTCYCSDFVLIVQINKQCFSLILNSVYRSKYLDIFALVEDFNFFLQLVFSVIFFIILLFNRFIVASHDELSQVVAFLKVEHKFHHSLFILVSSTEPIAYDLQRIIQMLEKLIYAYKTAVKKFCETRPEKYSRVYQIKIVHPFHPQSLRRSRFFDIKDSDV